ncbi:MAG: hypothetical protein ACE5OZ_08220 [Candidatus Heimdallarchaeota archaeon]
MNEIRGIPIEKLTKAYTDDKAVLAFFSKHSTLAFTVNMLLEADFSTNIRKVLNRLVDRGLLTKKTVKEENQRWEAAYFLAAPASSFLIRKLPPQSEEDTGWKLVEVQSNGLSIPMEFLHDETSFWVNVKLPEPVDAKFFFRNPEGNLHSLRLSGLQPILKERFNLALEIDVDADFDGVFDYSCDGPRQRKTRTRFRIVGNHFTQFAGAVGFHLEIDPAKRHIVINAVAWDDDTEDERHFDMERVGLGNYDEEQNSFEEELDDVTHILISF